MKYAKYYERLPPYHNITIWVYNYRVSSSIRDVTDSADKYDELRDNW